MVHSIVYSESTSAIFQGYDLLPDPVFIFTTDQHLMHCNNAAETFSGVIPDEKKEWSISDIFNRKLTECIKKELGDLSRTKQPKTVIIQNGNAEQTRLLRISTFLLASELPLSPYLVCLISDITSATDTADEKKRSLLLPETQQNRFLANMTHELRTPLNGIIGITELLDATSLDEHQHEYTGIIQMSCNALLSTVNSILDFSKVENGTMQHSTDVFSPEDIIFEEIAGISPRCAAKHIELGVITGRTLPARCSADARHFRSILCKILDNAVKFTEKGSIFVEASFHTDTANVSSLQITVTDTGIGIPPEKQNNLFSPFYQVDNSAVRKFGGIGLGLALAQRLVRLLGGEIRFCSSPGTGSSFSIFVPVTIDSATPSVSIPDLSGKHFLCIGIPYPTSEIFRHYFTDAGATADLLSPDEILHETTVAHSCDMLILDEAIPREKALHCIGRYRTGTSRAILASATQSGAVKVPFDGILQKPFRREALYTLSTSIHHTGETARQ